MPVQGKDIQALCLQSRTRAYAGVLAKNQHHSEDRKGLIRAFRLHSDPASNLKRWAQTLQSTENLLPR